MLWIMGVENKQEFYASICKRIVVNWTIESEHAGQAMQGYVIWVL